MVLAWLHLLLTPVLPWREVLAFSVPGQRLSPLFRGWLVLLKSLHIIISALTFISLPSLKPETRMSVFRFRGIVNLQAV